MPLYRITTFHIIVVLHACLLFIGLALLSACTTQYSQVTGPTVQPTVSPVTKTLGTFTLIDGTDYLIAPIEDNPDPSGSSFSLSSSTYTRPGTRNLIFIHRRDETVQQLLPTNDFVIVKQAGFPERSGTVGERSFPPITWFLYAVAKGDTNADGALTEQDLLTLAVSDVGGRGYTELLLNVDSVFGHTLQDANTLIVIYSSGVKKYLARIDLPGRRVLQVTELPSFGPDVD